MRLRIVSWFMVLCMVVPIGAQMLSAPTSYFTAGDASQSQIGKHSAHDQALSGVLRIGTGEKARKTMSLVTTCSQQYCSYFSLSPPRIECTGTAFPRSHALRVHQLISVYRI
jgi:hypothetical protein